MKYFEIRKTCVNQCQPLIAETLIANQRQRYHRTKLTKQKWSYYNLLHIITHCDLTEL